MFIIPFVTYRMNGEAGTVYQCKACGNPLTSLDQMVAIEGRTNHSFMNPSGIEFGFHTFSDCPGAAVVGDGTDAYSWFPGYQWRIAVCGRCGSHVGWHYQAMAQPSPLDAFWAIIVSSIVAS